MAEMEPEIQPLLILMAMAFTMSSINVLIHPQELKWNGMVAPRLSIQTVMESQMSMRLLAVPILQPQITMQMRPMMTGPVIPMAMVFLMDKMPALVHSLALKSMQQVVKSFTMPTMMVSLMAMTIVPVLKTVWKSMLTVAQFHKTVMETVFWMTMTTVQTHLLESQLMRMAVRFSPVL